MGALPLFGWAQNWCILPPSVKGLAQWRLYHLLPDGRGEAAAHEVLRLLLEDSIVRYVCYVYHVRVQYHRQGAWMLLDGEATEEGAYTFFHALRKAVETFPQRLQSYKCRSRVEGQWPQVAARQLWQDTMESPSALDLSRFFYEVWLGGKVRGVYWGRQGNVIRRLFPFIGADSVSAEEVYPWPEAPLTAQVLPPQAPMVFYTRWSVPKPSWAALLALWASLKELETFLCEEKQLSCQFFWSPTPKGMEVWIYTSLPYATAQALENFLSRPRKPPSSAFQNRFEVWQREIPAQLLVGQWACLWHLGKFQTPTPKDIRKTLSKIRGVFFAVSS